MIRQFEFIEAVQRFRAATDALAERVIMANPSDAAISYMPVDEEIVTTAVTPSGLA